MTSRLAHYEILGPLGKGGMGEVFLARDTRLDRRIALKVLPPELAADRERLERFRREARAVAAINHPNNRDRPNPMAAIRSIM
jgi:serine/threonine protein kinase